MRYVEFVRREENTIWGHISFGPGTTQWSTNRTKVENLFIGSNGLGMCQKWWKLVLPNGSTILRMLGTYITSLFHSFPSLQIPSLIQFDSEKRFQWNIELFHPIVLYRNMFRFSDSNREKNPIRFLHVQLFQLNIVCCPVHTSTVMALDAFEWNRRVTMRISNSCNWMLLLRVKSLEIFTRCNDFSSLFFCWRVSVLLSTVSEADILRFTFPFMPFRRKVDWQRGPEVNAKSGFKRKSLNVNSNVIKYEFWIWSFAFGFPLPFQFVSRLQTSVQLYTAIASVC